jgi:chromosome segregation ATPase
LQAKAKLRGLVTHIHQHEEASTHLTETQARHLARYLQQKALLTESHDVLHKAERRMKELLSNRQALEQRLQGLSEELDGELRRGDGKPRHVEDRLMGVQKVWGCLTCVH